MDCPVFGEAYRSGTAGNPVSAVLCLGYKRTYPIFTPLMPYRGFVIGSLSFSSFRSQLRESSFPFFLIAQHMCVSTTCTMRCFSNSPGRASPGGHPLLVCKDPISTSACLLPFHGEDFKSQSGQAGESHPHLPTEPYVKVSLHTALHVNKSRNHGHTNIQFWLLVVTLFRNNQSSLFGCRFLLKLNMLSPSLHTHYKYFITTTTKSAPYISPTSFGVCFL